MLKQEKHQKTKETGITLMVLVITIIILLILAGKSDKAIIGTIPTNDNDTEKILNIKNVYYDETKSNSIGATEEGITKMQIQNNENFVNVLNNNRIQNAEWLEWKLGEKGYPVFK